MTVFQIAVIGIFIGIMFAIGGNVMQVSRDNMNISSPGYAIADASLNMTAQATSMGKTTGMMIGVVILVGIGLVGLVMLMMYLVKNIKGGHEGGGRGRRFGG